MSGHHVATDHEPPEEGESRRGFLAKSLQLGLIGSLVASYGTFAAFALRFLYPARPQDKDWIYLAQVSELPRGGTLSWQTPTGAKVAVARLGEPEVAESFIALSSTCPHLGCQVHWEEQNNRFFCPCHNGVFDPQGKGIEGPPKGKNLARYPLKVERGLIYIQTPTEALPREESGISAQRGAVPGVIASQGCKPGCGCSKREERG